MTKTDVIDYIDTLMPGNVYSTETKSKWIDLLEEKIRVEILSHYEEEYQPKEVTHYKIEAASGSEGGGSILYGDANGDGKVTSSDIVRLKKYFAEYDPDTETSDEDIFPGADANGDGKVTSSDIVRLKKYFAEYDPDTGTSTVKLGPYYDITSDIYGELSFDKDNYRIGESAVITCKLTKNNGFRVAYVSYPGKPVWLLSGNVQKGEYVENITSGNSLVIDAGDDETTGTGTLFTQKMSFSKAFESGKHLIEAVISAYDNDEDSVSALIEPIVIKAVEEDVLLASGPYEDMYYQWVAAKINEAQNEITRYNNSMMQFNDAYSKFRNYFNRTHTHKKTNITVL